MRTAYPHAGQTANRVLWTVQALLAALFLFTGVVKLVLPLAALQSPVPLPGLFFRFLGVCEVLGALGLVLPGLTGIRPRLTALAAGGLVVIMAGATVVTAVGGATAQAAGPALIGVLAAVVAVRRWPGSAARGSLEVVRPSARARVA